MALVRAVLARDNKLKRQTRSSGAKRKSAAELSAYLSVSAFGGRTIRCASSFSSRAYSLDRQIEEFVSHLFVRYSVPRFLLRSVLTPEGRELVLREPKAKAHQKQKRAVVEWERSLFYAAAQGQSVAKLLTDHLTKKEAHWFMQAPDEYSVAQNILWARLAAHGVNPDVARLLMTRVCTSETLRALGGRSTDLWRFFGHYGAQMTPTTQRHLIDFVIAMSNQANFSFKGRTLRSMIKLSQEWHRMNRWGSLGAFCRWPSLFEPWEVRTTTMWVRAVELVSNRDLHEETRRQMHCVFTYLSQCMRGEARIVRVSWLADTMTGYHEMTRVTVEVCVHTKTVVQALGRANRSLSDEERRVIRLWASANGLRIAPYVWW